MEPIQELRRLARERRDKRLALIEEEYAATLDRIAVLARDLLGREQPRDKSVMAAVGAVLPTDGSFTSADVMRNLEAAYPHRAWKKRTVDECITRLVGKKMVRRISPPRASPGRHGSTPAVYVREGVKVDRQPFENVPLRDLLFQTLALIPAGFFLRCRL